MVSLILLAGCGAVVTGPTGELEPPFREEVLESLLGSTKEEVLQQLGQPIRRLKGGDETYFIYRGRVDVAGIAIIGLPMPWWSDTQVCSMLEFGGDQRLRRFETYGDYVGFHTPKSCIEAFWSPDEAEALKMRDQQARAERGDPRAQVDLSFMLGSRGDDKGAWHWICQAASQDYGPAQRWIGKAYFYERWSAPRDLVKAYLWCALAEANEAPCGSLVRTGMADEMTPEQIAEAERLVKEWQPNPAECEALPGATLSEN
jgi:hypothetical protein